MAKAQSREHYLPCAELRVYYPAPGQLQPLVKRFLASRPIFDRQGITVIGYTVGPNPAGSETVLIYVLAAPSLKIYRSAWKAFAEDPQWQVLRDSTDARGRLVQKIENQFLHAPLSSARPERQKFP